VLKPPGEDQRRNLRPWHACINPACFRWGTSLKDFVFAAHKAGFRHVEVSIQQVLELGRRLGGMGVLAARLSSMGMRVEQFSGLLPAGPVLPAPLLIDEGPWKAALGTLTERLDAAAALGCTRAAITCNPRTSQAAEAARELALHRLSLLATRSSAYDIRLAVEFIGVRSGLDPSLDGPHLFIADLAEMVHLLADLGAPNVGLLLDTCHLYASQMPLDQIPLMAQGRVTFLQVSDVPMGVLPDAMTDADRCPPGDGMLDLPALLHAISEAGYRGPASIELFSPEVWALDPEMAAERLYAAAVKALGSPAALERPSYEKGEHEWDFGSV
jgi:sugar phosphate isomerase/epimerase